MPYMWRLRFCHIEYRTDPHSYFIDALNPVLSFCITEQDWFGLVEVASLVSSLITGEIVSTSFRAQRNVENSTKECQLNDQDNIHILKAHIHPFCELPVKRDFYICHCILSNPVRAIKLSNISLKIPQKH